MKKTFQLQWRTSSRAALNATTTALPLSPPCSASAVIEESTEAELEAVAGRLEAVAGWLENVAGWLEAVAGRLEAVAGRLEAVTGRLEAVAGWLEAVAGRLEAVAGRETPEPVALVDPTGGRAVVGRDPPELALSGRQASAPPLAKHSAVALYRVHSAPVVV
jgi:hypothetical protein